MNKLFEFIDQEDFNNIFEKEKSGFEPLPEKQVCNHPGHNVPMHLFVPPNQQYRHVCPNCGNTVLIGGSAIRFQ